VGDKSEVRRIRQRVSKLARIRAISKGGRAGGSGSIKADGENVTVSHRRGVVLPIYEHVLQVLYSVCVAPAGAGHQVAEASRLALKGEGEGGMGCGGDGDRKG
jgi:hypothetical protein